MRILIALLLVLTGGAAMAGTDTIDDAQKSERLKQIEAQMLANPIGKGLRALADREARGELKPEDVSRLHAEEFKKADPKAVEEYNRLLDMAADELYGPSTGSVPAPDVPPDLKDAW